MGDAARRVPPAAFSFVVATALWSIVFPVGMHSAARITLGTTTGATFVVGAVRIGTGRIGTVIAWLAVLVLAVHAPSRSRRHDDGRCSPGAAPRL